MTTKTLHLFLGAVAAFTAFAIVWLDISTNVWQEYSVISSLAAALVTFILTALLVDRLIARSAHQRWAPVTRIALGELRRKLAAESDTSQPGLRRARRLPDASTDPQVLVNLIRTAEAERDVLSTVLARWSSFLASSADVVEIMDAVAEIAERLDRIDEHAKELERVPVRTATGAAGGDTDPSPRLRALQDEIDAYHRAGDELMTHIDEALEQAELRTQPL